MEKLWGRSCLERVNYLELALCRNEALFYTCMLVVQGCGFPEVEQMLLNAKQANKM